MDENSYFPEEAAMSGSQPVRPQGREIEILRALFERKLKGRAIALAESRWPGSGQMIDLAYEWSSLPATERRARLSEIGPEEIARLRSLSSLHPDLDAAVTELDRRGVLPHLEAAAQAGAGSLAGPPGTEQATEPQAANIEHAQAGEAQELPVVEAETVPDPEPLEVERGQAQPEIVPEGIDAGAEDLEDYELDVDMPDLDLGLPSTTEFLNSETERRARALQHAQSSLERVRQRLDRSTERILSRSPETRLPDSPTMAPVVLPEMPSVVEAMPLPAHLAERPAAMVEAPQWLVDAFAEDTVVTVVEPHEPPSEDELVALANALGVGLKEFRPKPGSLRVLYGGLVNRAGVIDVEAGPLPAALADKNLAVIRGRVYPSYAERLRQGYADIPGTRATVQLHEKSRVLVIPGG